MAVPPTPALPRVSTDESMLLDTDPIFGDVTLGEADWMEPTPGSMSIPRTTREHLSAFVEEEEEELNRSLMEDKVLSGRVERQQEYVNPLSTSSQEGPASTFFHSSTPTMRASWSSTQHSITPLAKSTQSISANAKCDDLFARRLSDSVRATARHASPLLIPTQGPSHNRDHESSFSGSDREISIVAIIQKQAPTAQPPFRRSKLSRYLQQASATGSLPAPDAQLVAAEIQFPGQGQSTLPLPPMSSQRIQLPAVLAQSSRTPAEHPTPPTPTHTSTLPPASLRTSSVSDASPASNAFQLSTSPSSPASASSIALGSRNSMSQHAQPITTYTLQEPFQTLATSTPMKEMCPQVHRTAARSSGIPIPTLVELSEGDSSHQSIAANGLRVSRSEQLLSFFTGFLRASTNPGPPPPQQRERPINDREPSEVVHENEKWGNEQEFDRAHRSPVKWAPLLDRPARPIPTKPTTRRNPPGFVPLTRPIPVTRALMPLRTVTSNATRPPASLSESQKSSVPKVRPPSAFATTALARLPPPGKGHASAAKPVRVRTPERARDIASKKRVFEGPSGQPSIKPMTRTIPIVGKTPGKASRHRAALREQYKVAARDRQAEESHRSQMEKRR